jgi:ABC-type glycerol-3-phosphate transport system substrate-binding protein
VRRTGKRLHRRSAVLGVTAATAVATLATACSSSGGGNAPTALTKNPSGNITYFWWGDPTRNQKTDAVINLFEKQYPHVKVSGEAEAFNQYWQKVTVQAAAHDLPCVTQTQSRELQQYTDENVFMPLNSLISKGYINVSGMPKNVLDSGKGKDGKIYMIPYGAAYDGFAYNKTIAQKAGLPDPPQGYSWAWLENWLKQAKKKLPAGEYPIDQNGSDADIFISYAESNGYSLFNKSGQLGFPESLLKQYWTIWENFAKQGIALPENLAAQEPAVIQQSDLVQGKVMVEAEPGNQLYDGQVAADSAHTGTLAMTTHPFGPKGIGNVVIPSGLSIPASCNNVSAAAAFINYFTNNPSGAKVYASNNGAVTDTSLLNQQLTDPSTGPVVKEELNVYKFIVNHNTPVVLYPPGFSNVFETLYPEIFQKIASGEESVDAGVQSFFAQAKSNLS